METDELVEEVLDIANVDEEDADEELVLKLLNRGNLTLASSLLLPWLIENDQVTTVIGGYSVDLPESYHRNLFQVTISDGGIVRDIPIYSSLRSLSDAFGTLTGTTGEMKGACVSGRKLLYQETPPAPISVDMFFYGYPADLSEVEPEWDNADFDQALIHFACWRIAEKIEDGTEGKKVNTKYHKDMYDELVETLKFFCLRYGDNYVTNAPTINKTW